MNETNSMDVLMTAALREIIREDWNTVTSDPDARPLKTGFNRRMERKILDHGKSGKTHGKLKRIGIGILVAVAVFAMLGMAIPPVRKAVINTIFTWYDTHFGVRYEVETDEPIPTVIEEVILPAWLPDGWTLETEYSGKAGVAHILSDGNGNVIDLEQTILQPDHETTWFDNTDVEIETVLLNGHTEAQLFSYGDGGRVLTWAERYVFILAGYADMGGDVDVLIRIAESMKASGFPYDSYQ